MFEGKTLWEIFPPEIAARDEPVLRAALEGVATRVEVPFGAATFVVDTLPVKDEQGTIVGGMVMTQDITERKRAEEERVQLLAAEQAARAEAEAALQVRDAFLSIASHELRTPLTALQGYAGMLRNRIAGRQDGDAQTVRLADTLLRQVDRMSRLIGHLLDVSRLQHGQFAVDLVPMDLAALVTQIVDEFRLTLPIGAPSPAIELTRPEDEVLVLGDPSRLEEVVQNLLTNAVKYSPGGGVVRVRVTQRGADALVEVTDQGIGIPPEAKAHLFEPFYRAGNVDRRTSGFGIGLYVVREIVQGHGGRIVATSTEGQGSTFCVALPVHAGNM
jgi:signal transduction histidine kinase